MQDGRPYRTRALARRLNGGAALDDDADRLRPALFVFAVRVIAVSFSTFKRDRVVGSTLSAAPASHLGAAGVPESSSTSIPTLEGDTGLADMFRAQGPSLLRYLRRHAGEDAAADLMQDVFVRAAGSGQRNRLVNPGGFLCRIAQNLLKDRARKRKRDNVVLFPLHEERDAASAPEQEHELEANDLLRTYEKAVEAMSEKTRRVFLMCRVDGLSYQEVHEQLGISIATVEYHMVKALGHLADALEIKR